MKKVHDIFRVDSPSSGEIKSAVTLVAVVSTVSRSSR